MPWSDPERRREYHDRYYRKNKARWTELRKLQTPAQKERARTYMENYALRREYGISMEDYQRMLKKQRGLCAICSLPSSRHRLHVDHCHKTGKLRKLLCRKCNMALGVFETNKDAFEKYLKECS